jgi:TonB-linked SusC/RagA family outer membrane protein
MFYARVFTAILGTLGIASVVSTAGAQSGTTAVALAGEVHTGPPPTRSPVTVAPAQTGTVFGQVTDVTTGEPIPGVSVVLEGTQWGTLTGDRGQYRLPNIPPGSYTLTARRIGYGKTSRPVTVAEDREVRVDLALHAAANVLDQIVVTGTVGAETRRSLGNSISTIQAPEAVQRSGVSDVGTLINGRAPGVIVTSGSGLAGSGPSINIRGRSTISLGQQPLIYIDGARVDNDAGTGPQVNGGTVISRLNDLSPEDIESIEIIKGPAAATIYGTEAANGVIQIITKKGHAGKTELGMTVRGGTNWFMNPEGRIPTNYGKDPSTGDILTWNAVQQEDARGTPIWQNGNVQSYGLRMTGGPGTLRYYLSTVYDKEKGVEPNNFLDRFTGHANLTIAPNDKFDLTSSINVVRGTTHLGADYTINSAISAALYGSPLAANTPTRGFFVAPPEVWYAINDFSQAVNRFTGSVQLRHRPTSWFDQRLTVGLDQTEEDNQALSNFAPPQYQQFFPPAAAKGQISQNLLTVTYSTVDYNATATAPIATDMTAATSVGVQYYRRRTNTTAILGQQFPAPGVKTAAGASVVTGSQDYVVNSTVGMYAQEQLAWRNRLFLTGAVRVDNNSAFGEDIKWVTYPKVSGSWVVSEEPFWKISAINTLKLRAAFGASGQQPADFAALQTYQPATGPGDQPIVTTRDIGNPNLKPERSQELEAGFEMGLFNRINVDFTWYTKKTKDAILLRESAPSLGFPNPQYVNIGQVSNHGVELQVNAQAIAKPNFAWNLTAGLSTAKDRIDDMGGLAPIVLDLPFQQNAQGYPIGAIFSKKVLSAEFDPATGQAINAMCDGGPENGHAPMPCADAPQVFFGTTTPKFIGSVGTDLTFWNRLTLHGMVDFKGGNKLVDMDGLLRCSFFSVCEAAVSPEKFSPEYVATVQNGSTLQYVDAFVHNGNFARLREISASYTLPDRWAQRVRASGATLTVAGRNLHTWTSYPGLDPESRSRPVSQLVFDEAVMPTLAQFIATLQLTF